MYNWKIVEITKKKEKKIQVRLSKDEYNKIKEISKGKGRSISGQIRHMIIKEYEDYHLFDPIPREEIDR